MLNFETAKLLKSNMAAIISAESKIFEMKMLTAQMDLCSTTANAPTRRLCKEAK